MIDPIDQFRAALNANGIIPDEIIADGAVHRCHIEGSRKLSGAYQLFMDGRPAGWLQNHASGGGVIKWRASGRHASPITHEMIEAAREVREATKVAEQQGVARIAQAMWISAQVSDSHSYLRAKGITSCGTRVRNNHLLVPVRDEDGSLVSLQTISPTGTKRFLPGGMVKGCYHAIGRPEVGKVVVCEGFATGASIRMATGLPVAVAFNCTNLLEVGLVLRRKYPFMALLFAADDDWQNRDNPGLTHAKAAAKAVKGKVVQPKFKGKIEMRGDKDSDWNDVMLKDGIDAVRRAFAKV